jgi:hypothetical protein
MASTWVLVSVFACFPSAIATSYAIKSLEYNNKIKLIGTYGDEQIMRNKLNHLVTLMKELSFDHQIMGHISGSKPTLTVAKSNLFEMVRVKV